MDNIDKDNYVDIVCDHFKHQSHEIDSMAETISDISDQLHKAVEMIGKCNGKVIVSGMGKSGIIGSKIAATLSSTGTPSFFVHPGEAYHGDLGMIEKSDVVILISNSGETDEILKMIPFLQKQSNEVISITSNMESTLALNSGAVLLVRVEKEGCPLDLAPMASTTATIVMGDALAVLLMKMRRFTVENFAVFHPGGSLGKKLLISVNNVMRRVTPKVARITPVSEVVHAISAGMCGITAVIENDEIVGVVTDGDIRRHMEHVGKDFFTLNAEDIMSSSPITVFEDVRLLDAEEIFSENQVGSILVLDKGGRFTGVLTLHDL